MDEDLIISDCDVEVTERFLPKRLQSIKLSDSYDRLGYKKKSSMVADCGTYLEYHIRDDKGRLAKANFCRDRLCPMCSWRRTIKLWHQVSQVMDNLKDYQFLFVTLTVRNCNGSDLREVVFNLNKAFTRFWSFKDIRSRFKGYFKSLEITHDNYPIISRTMWHGDKECHIKPRKNYYKRLGLKIGDKNPTYDTYHPHLHIIFAVNRSYFKKNYLKQDYICTLWQKALGVDYKPICDIRTVKEDDINNSKSDINYKSAVCEVTKYTLKDADYLTGSNDFVDNTVKTLSDSLYNVRLASFGGVFKDVRDYLQLDDPIDGDLLHVSDDDYIRDDVTYTVVRYRWYCGAYHKSVTGSCIDIEVEDKYLI